MKHTVKRALALFIALLLAMPTFAFAEAPEDPVIVIENAFDAADQEEITASMDIDPSVSEAEALQLGDPDEPVDQDPGIIEGLTLDPEEPAGEDTAAVEDAIIGENIADDAGVFPDDETPMAEAEAPVSEAEPAEEMAEAPASEAEPVRVVFDTVPETAVVKVYTAQKPSPLGEGGSASALTEEVVPDPAPIPARRTAPSCCSPASTFTPPGRRTMSPLKMCPSRSRTNR